MIEARGGDSGASLTSGEATCHCGFEAKSLPSHDQVKSEDGGRREERRYIKNSPGVSFFFSL